MKGLLNHNRIENLRLNKKIIFYFSAFVALLLVVTSLLGFNYKTLFNGNHKSLSIAVIANYENQNASDAGLLIQGIQDGLKSVGANDAFDLKQLADSENRESLEKNKAILESDKSILTTVGPLSRTSVVDYPDIAEELKIPLLIPRNPPKELQDPTWTFAMQQNMFTKSGLVTSLLIKDLTPKRIGVVIKEEDRKTPYFTGITQVLLDSNAQVESTEVVKLSDIEDAKSTTSLMQYDLLYLDLSTDFAVEVIKNLKDHNYQGRIVLFDDRLEPNFAKEFASLQKEREHPGFYASNVHIVTNFSQDVSNDLGRTLAQKYIETNGKSPEPTYVSGYDTGVLLGTYYKQVYSKQDKSLTIEEIRSDFQKWLANLEKQTVPMQNFTGDVKFGVTHERNLPPRILEYKDNNNIEPYSSQLSNIPPIRVADDDRTIVIDYQDPKSAIVNHLKYTIVPVAFTAIHVRSISDISINKGLFKSDFDIWFRSKVPIKTEDIVFDPTPDEPPKAEIVETEKKDDLIYTRIRFKGTFPFFLQPKDIGLSTINLQIRWLHHTLNASKLFFVIDYEALNQNSTIDPIYKKVTREGVIDPSTGYTAISSMISAAEDTVPAYGNLQTVGNTDNFSSGWLKLTLSSESGLISKAGIVNFFPNFTLGLICLLLAGILVFLRLSKKILPAFHFPDILGYSVALTLLFVWEMFFFTNSYTQLMPRSWMLFIRNLLDFVNYMLVAAFVSESIRFLFTIRKKFHGIGETILKVVHFMIYIVAIAFFYTNVLEKDILPILATSSVILTVVGLAIRDVIFDFIAGIAISFDKTLKQGQWVYFTSRERRIDGIIEELGWRNVIIKSKDETKHVIPNSQIYAIVISNNSITDGNRRVDVVFFTNTNVDIMEVFKNVMAVTMETLKIIPGVPLEKPVRIIFEKIHADGLQLKMQFFLRDRESGEQARSIALYAIHQELSRMNALPARMVQSQSMNPNNAEILPGSFIEENLKPKDPNSN
jgi:small-conductance mechanosensitive channel